MSEHQNSQDNHLQPPYPEYVGPLTADVSEHGVSERTRTVGRWAAVSAAALAATAAVVIVAGNRESGGGIGGEAFPHAAEAAVVAERFEGDLTGVVDRHMQPGEDFPVPINRPEKYTVVDLTVQTQTKTDEETQTVLARYEEDDTIWWTEPTVTGAVYTEGKTLDQMPIIISPRSIGFDDGEYSMPVGLHTDYPEGTKVLITLNNVANVISGEGAVDATQVVGAVEWSEGTWQEVPASEMPDVDRATIVSEKDQ